jgi:hypothetical protein
MNLFPELEIADVLSYLNVEQKNDRVTVFYHWKDEYGNTQTEKDSIWNGNSRTSTQWVNDSCWEIEFGIPTKLSTKPQKVPFKVVSNRVKEEYEQTKAGEVWPEFVPVEVAKEEDVFKGIF